MTPHEILGVPRDATPEQVKKAYRRKAFEFHPDRNAGDTEAATKFKQVQDAYETITRPVIREPGVPSGWPFPDIFNDFFSFRAQPQRGRDIYADVTLDFMQAAAGCEADVKIRRGDACASCGGSGATDVQTCNFCQGQGVITFRQGITTIRTTCSHCGGEGRIATRKCNDCGGDGITSETSVVRINIPEGIRDGDRIRLAGQGEKPGGDAVVKVLVAPHPLFSRRGDDLVFTLPVTFTQAVLGATLKIPTLTGVEEVTVSPGSKSGQEIVLTGMGLANPQTGRRGDCVAVLEIDTNVTDERILKKLHKLGLKSSAQEALAKYI